MQKTLTIPYPIVPNKEAYSTCNFEKLKIGKHYLVWWFGGILREQKHRSIQTTFQVIFREVIEKNEHSTVVGEFVTEYLSVQPYLTSFRIGYIWQRTKYHSTVVDEMINLPVFSLTTSFNESNWCIREINEQKYINPDIQAFLKVFPLPHSIRDKSKLLELVLENKQKLFVSNIAFLAKSYERVAWLMTYPYESSHPMVKTIKNLLIRPIESEKSDGKWRVFTLSESDCIFLAHFKYDTYTQKVIKKLTNQRIKAWLNTKSGEVRSIFYPSIQPWYTDNKVEIEVRGFLCNGNIIRLDILSISDPTGPIIEWHSPTRKMGKYPPSIDRVLHISQFNKQLDLPLDD